MWVRLRPGIRHVVETFGGIIYVPQRDDFFAADPPIIRLIKGLSTAWTEATAPMTEGYAALARLGIVETSNPATPEISYSGPSFLGSFQEIPSVTQPLVVNCFATAYCPLRCVYCHADDLMARSDSNPETDRDLENVVATANAVPSLVAVITGGDPLTRPERARVLIERLSTQKALVMDTSGVGDIEPLLSLLARRQVHVRVSLDAANPKINASNRPPNFRDKLAPRGASAMEGARTTIRACLDHGIPVTVQSVITSRTENQDELNHLRNLIIDWGVRHWVLHIVVRGGKARQVESVSGRLKGPNLLPSADVSRLLRQFIESSNGIDIRCTDTDTKPNSVLLIDSRGDLYTEWYAHNGKVRLYAANSGRPDLVRHLWAHIDWFGHASRYLNWNRTLREGESLRDRCYSVPLSEPAAPDDRLVENEVKYQVLDQSRLRDCLSKLGYVPRDPVRQRDEYYDTDDKRLKRSDYVVRVRSEAGEFLVALKGPRWQTEYGGYPRIELEFKGEDQASIAQDLERHGLTRTWFLEKTRVVYTKSGLSGNVVIDEVPEIGYYLEIEGNTATIENLARELRDMLAPDPEMRNYERLFLDHMRGRGVPENEVPGAAFQD